MSADRPNLLLITSDQQHWRALGTRDARVRTPNLDRLAARGVDFTRAYCPNPTCTPTRASLLTGTWPSVHGAYALGTGLDPKTPVIGDVLRAAGYATGLIGKAHFQPLAGSADRPSVESYPLIRDLDFWRTFNDRQTPWYGFDHVELTRNHTDEGHVGQHYAIWMEERGLSNWRDYFHPRGDGVRESPTEGALAPRPHPALRFGYRAETRWRLPADFHYTTWTAERTNAFIERQHAAGKPWFCWSSYHDPHPPYCCPEPWASMYDPADMDFLLGDAEPFDAMPPPHRMTRDAAPDFRAFDVDGHGVHGYASHAGATRDDLRGAAAVYCGMISFMDDRLGTTLDRLDALGIAGDTIVAFTSDHGHFLGQHGLLGKGPFLYDDVIRVPLIAAGPGVPRGRVNDAVQTIVDLPALFAAATTGRVPPTMQARDPRDAWWRDAGPRDAIVVEDHVNGSEVHLRTLVTATHKLTVYRGRSEWGELFDLAADPGERTNLYHAQPALRAELMSRFVQAELEREPVPQLRTANS